jgi:aminopeptidase S
MRPMKAAPIPRRAVAPVAILVLAAACGGPPAVSAPSSGAASQTATPSASGSGPPGASASPVPALTATTLSDRIEADRLNEHLTELQAIADDSGGNRATGTIGFERSVEYVEAVLDGAGYDVERQAFAVGSATSWNVVTERPGTGAGVLVLGAHLDSVAIGAGINDNASGVAALLVIAEALRDLPAPSLSVRFAFWGAEEGGPFGSPAYVASLDADALALIRAYLNFDMIGSPNAVTFVYDEAGAAAGSDAVTTVVSRYFDRRGLPWEPIDLDGDSDHRPFIEAGVPTGGLFSGGIEPVTPEQATRHGAVAGQPADACSHAACDGIANVDLARLALLTDAIAAILVDMAATRAR